MHQQINPGQIAAVFFFVLIAVVTPVRGDDTANVPGINTSALRVNPLYHIGAYYFGYWGPHFPQDQLRHYQAVYGHVGDWWSGVRDLYEPEITATQKFDNADFSHLKPVIGYYDLSQPRAIEQHIAQATSFGLDFFNFYFYWDASLQGEGYGDGLNSFLQASNRNAIHFMLSIVAKRPVNVIPAEQFDVVSAYIAKRYFAQSNYLQAPDGRLLVEVLNNTGIGDGSAKSTDAFVAKLRAAARAYAGKDIFLLATTNDPNYTQWRSNDGYSCSDHFLYPEGVTLLQKSYKDYIKNEDAYFKTVRRYMNPALPLLYCVSSGHDERPRLYLNTQANDLAQIDALRVNLPYYTDRSPELFRQALVATKGRMDASTDLMKTYLNIYAWNEWNEGGIIEPNIKDGFAYLQAIAEVFNTPPAPFVSVRH